MESKPEPKSKIISEQIVDDNLVEFFNVLLTIDKNNEGLKKS